MIDPIKNKKDFPLLVNHPELIYFDNASTTFKPKAVIDAVTDYYQHQSVNIHRGDYALSLQVSNQYDAVHCKVAQFIGSQAKEIVFTSGASEALNMVALQYGMSFISENDVILTTEAEHASNILPWFHVAKVKKAKIE